QLAARNTAPQQLLRRVDTGGVRALLVLADGQVFGSVPDGATGNPPPRSRTVVLRGAGRLNAARLTLSVETTVIATAQTQLRRLLLLTGLIALAVTAVLLVLVIRFALAPLDAMTGLARSIARGGRGKRL